MNSTLQVVLISLVVFQILTLVAHCIEYKNWFGLGRCNFGMMFSMCLIWIPYFIAYHISKKVVKALKPRH